MGSARAHKASRKKSSGKVSKKASTKNYRSSGKPKKPRKPRMKVSRKIKRVETRNKLKLKRQTAKPARGAAKTKRDAPTRQSSKVEPVPSTKNQTSKLSKEAHQKMMAGKRSSPSPEKDTKNKPFTAEWKCISSMKREMIKKRQAFNRKNNKTSQTNSNAPKFNRNIKIMRRGGQRVIKVQPISYSLEPSTATIHPL